MQACARNSPEREVTASNLAAIADAVEPYRVHLPVVTQEIGDTWIYGVPSDPLKVARYLEVARLREASGSERASFKRATPATWLSWRSFLLEVEHTWGTDTKTWLDFDHYTPHDLAAMLDQPKYKVVLSSWQEKRQDLMDADCHARRRRCAPKPTRRVAALDAVRARSRRDCGRTPQPSRSRHGIS